MIIVGSLGALRRLVSIFGDARLVDVVRVLGRGRVH